MPPEENKLKIGIDPIFKNGNNIAQKVSDQNFSSGVSQILNNQKYIPNENTSPTTPNQIKTNTNPKSIVRTFKGDLASAIEANHLSSINIALAENEKLRNQIKTETKESSPSEYSKNKILTFISLILLILGLIGIASIFFFNKSDSETAPFIPELPALITTEYKDELNVSSLNKNAFIDNLAGKLNNSQIPVNKIYNIYLTTGTSTNRKLIRSVDFINLAEFNMPDLIKRTLTSDFMIGTYSSSNKNEPFLILKSSYFENAYAGMLGWESYLEEDLRFIFRLPNYEKGVDILPDFDPAAFKRFEDGVIINKDVRLIRNANQEIILLYGIIDKETIIITVSDKAFKEIIDRLNKEKSLIR